MNVDRNRQRAEPAPTAENARLEALVRLSGSVAHDFNNILHVLKNAVGLLRHKVPAADPEAAWLLEMLERNVERGTRLTDELLAFAGRRTLRPAALNANRLIADGQHRLRDALGRSVQIETVLTGSLCEVQADASELETAIFRLAENARDAMNGAGKITITTANAEVSEVTAAHAGIGAGSYVSIAVQDTGAGMDEAMLPFAFDPYYTTKEPGPMTGLGLARVHGFVRQMGGHVAVKSAPGAGTTVTLYLPSARRSDSEAAAEVLPINPQPARPAKALAGLRVLVVEDESLIGMLAEDLLEQLGCRMAGLVSSLGSALTMAKTADIDLALLDVDIGGQPVYPVAMALQARGIPFLFMSGYGGLDDPWRGRPIVQKPFDLEQLSKQIERALR